MKKIVVLDAKTIGEFDVNLLKEFGEVVTYQTTSKDETIERVKMLI